ncbi:hypothetical protein MMALV_12050 [Candidatus Methanomethylophilus alvi Mx1201]|uniref:Uncharacterized protein n=1 Tax=Methanomethylophilus alvi (strain Mx1201) TaxID=1236689 RepID=M9SKF2_METAX|nr:hypothetical protein MMALV_12050 [Candidatus Methanomethylophilus alvi Mx1201]
MITADMKDAKIPVFVRNPFLYATNSNTAATHIASSVPVNVSMDLAYF